MKNKMGKSRKTDDPYIISEDPHFPGWEWRVLKAWQADGGKPYARVFCAVKSPFTRGSFDLGDTYTTEVGGYITYYDPEVFESKMEALVALKGEQR